MFAVQFMALAIAASALLGLGTTSAGAVEPALENPIYYGTQPENRWGVDGLDPGSGNFRYYSPVFALTQIDDTIYAGGKFLTVVGPGQSIDQPYLAAFTEGGEWESSFRPDITWSVFDIESDAAGNRLFVGGEFPSAGGDSTFAGFAALNPSTGALDASFGVSVARSTGDQPRVHALHQEGRWLYLAGSFNRITDSTGVTRWTNNVARVDATTGVHDRTWRPRVSGGSVWEVAADPLRNRVIIGGLFRSVNGIQTPAFAMVDDTTGATEEYDYGFGLRYFDRPNNNYDFVTSVAVTPDRLVIGGQEHRTLITEPDLTVISSHITNNYSAYNGGKGGDTQALALSGDMVFVACHCWGRARNEATGALYDVRSIYAIDLETGEFVTSFNPDFSGSSGPWALHIDPNRCLWAGTDATQSGQAAAQGVVKLCPQHNLAWEGQTNVSASGPITNRPAGALVDQSLVTNDLGAGSSGVNPYFDLQLEERAMIDQVVVWNSTNQNGQALTNVHLWVSDQPFTTADWDALRADPNVTEYVRMGDHGVKKTLPIDIGEHGQYIRVQVEGETTLVLTEVAVIGEFTGQQVEPNAVPTTCSVAVDGTTATITWEGAGTNDQIIYREVNGGARYWRDRTSADSYSEQLRTGGATHDYFVGTVGAGGSSVATSCSPVQVTAELEVPEPTITVEIRRTTRERIVFRYLPEEPVTISRDGTVVATDDNGWYTDLGLSAGTQYVYTFVSADGATTTIEASTLP